MEELVDSDDFDIKMEVAKYEKTPANILSKLARDKSWFIRQAVACNLNTPVEALNELVKDKNSGVRAWATKNLQERNE